MIILYYLLLLHFVSDFLMQNRYIAENKSKDFSVMTAHCLIIFFLFAPILSVLPHGILFAFVYSLIHFLQDTFVWRSYKYIITKTWRGDIRGFKYWEENSFYSTIGFDQMLHVATLIFLQKVFL